jgi:hypothetical protein
MVNISAPSTIGHVPDKNVALESMNTREPHKLVNSVWKTIILEKWIEPVRSVRAEKWAWRQKGITVAYPLNAFVTWFLWYEGEGEINHFLVILVILDNNEISPIIKISHFFKVLNMVFLELIFRKLLRSVQILPVD